MRYPGKSHRERVLQPIIFLIAFLLFISASALAIKNKFVAASYSHPRPTPTFEGAPSPSPTGTTALRLFNITTAEPIRNQNIAFIITSTCDSTTVSCPTTSPIVLTTDENGELKAPRSLIAQKPKLYAAGYKTDRYFTFFPENPNSIIVYYPPAEAKTSYNITLEIVPVGLQPATP
jgi:hypothetical protein